MAKKLKIAVIGGDGTGPEVAAEAVKVLQAVGKLEKIDMQFDDFDINGNRYIKTGTIITDEEVAALRKYSSILLGAIGHPDVEPGIL
jgi:3-isopropylmalate dehydrogenase